MLILASLPCLPLPQLPIGLSLFQRRAPVASAPWSFGSAAGYVVNSITVAWIAFSVVLFSFPTAKTTDPASINYASVVFVGFFAFAAFYYVVWGRKSFRVSKRDRRSEPDAR